jgi:hypothetical protein
MPPPAPTVVYGDLTPVLLRLSQRLAQRGVVASEQAVIIVDDPPNADDTPHVMGDRDLLLYAGDESPGPEDGGGEWDTRSHARLIVMARSRSELDEMGRARQILTNPAGGHYPFRGLVRRAVHLFFADDSLFGHNLLLVQPARWLSTRGPVRDKKDPTWVSSTLTFEFVYAVDLERPTTP